MTIGAVAQALELPLEGSPDLEITGLAGLEDAGPADLSFVSAAKHAGAYASSGAGACIVFSDFDAIERPCLRSASPYADFARAIELLYPRRRPDPGVHPTAVVPGDVTLGRDVSIRTEALHPFGGAALLHSLLRGCICCCAAASAAALLHLVRRCCIGCCASASAAALLHLLLR